MAFNGANLARFVPLFLRKKSQKLDIAELISSEANENSGSLENRSRHMGVSGPEHIMFWGLPTVRQPAQKGERRVLTGAYRCWTIGGAPFFTIFRLVMATNVIENLHPEKALQRIVFLILQPLSAKT